MSFICFLFCMAFSGHCLAENVYRSPSEKRTADSSCNAILNTTSKKVDGIFGKIDQQEDTLVEEIRTLDRHVFTRIDAIGDRIQELEEAIQEIGSTEKQSKKLDSILDRMDEKEEYLVDMIQASEKRMIRKIASMQKGNTRTCFDLQKQGETESGVYNLTVFGTQVEVYCDMETEQGGWLVFQRRKDGSVDFYRDWAFYKTGFGDRTGEFWLGNDNIYEILRNSGEKFELRIDLENWKGVKKYAKYSTFKIASEDYNYRLTVGGYSGNAGDAMDCQNEQQFSTKDRDNDPDTINCAQYFKGAWWYCKWGYKSNLNGEYLHRPQSFVGEGLSWFDWTGWKNYLTFTEMKMRPKLYCN